MRVSVTDVSGIFATTAEAGERLYALIAPVLARGEEVVLDFEEVKHYSIPFFMASIEVLIEADNQQRLPALLRYENLSKVGQIAVDSATDFAIRCRENPRLKEGYYAGARRLAERD